ncbi:hypothetical protein KC19_3G171300 [Ceratodon purpureus]|uniref:Uncharacterized protein n=1 Tax=Ceratodon purpureus TaxID=3225 RepID=A0A8T0IN95_CERPU|nr:hypothetical protein KC19_3G171300 [Ceratodon purpureus]
MAGRNHLLSSCLIVVQALQVLLVVLSCQHCTVGILTSIMYLAPFMESVHFIFCPRVCN